jgi:polyisoprenoid-binding protein YceI
VGPALRRAPDLRLTESDARKPHAAPVALPWIDRSNYVVIKRCLPLLALGLFTGVVGAALSAAIETYVADPAQTSVNFTVRNVFTRVRGSFKKVDAMLQIDRQNLENSSAEAVIEIASIDTGEGKRDAHLLKPEFFDATKFPNITFASKGWTKTGENTFDVTGDLTIRGVTKPILIKVRSAASPSGAGQLRSVWEATAKINRHDFGVSAYDKIIGAEVDIAIHVEMVRN